MKPYEVGTFKNDLFKMDQRNVITEWYHTQSNPSITDNSVRSLLVDQDNKVWIGTFHGLNKSGSLSFCN